MYLVGETQRGEVGTHSLHPAQRRSVAPQAPRVHSADEVLDEDAEDDDEDDGEDEDEEAKR